MGMLSCRPAFDNRIRRDASNDDHYVNCIFAVRPKILRYV